MKVKINFWDYNVKWRQEAYHTHPIKDYDNEIFMKMEAKPLYKNFFC